LIWHSNTADQLAKVEVHPALQRLLLGYLMLGRKLQGLETFAKLDAISSRSRVRREAERVKSNQLN